MSRCRSVTIKTEPEAPALVRRAAEILSRQIRERSGVAADAAPADLTVSLVLRPELGQEAFAIEGEGGKVVIAGGDPCGVLYGAGRFLRGSDFRDGFFMPCTWRGSDRLAKPVRGMYYATHFHNFHHEAPVEGGDALHRGTGSLGLQRAAGLV